jgi:hypothetical protein
MLRKVEPIKLGGDVRVDVDHIAVTGLPCYDYAQEFEFGMDLILDSLEGLRGVVP